MGPVSLKPIAATAAALSLAISPAVATAAKDYSKNGATGDFTPAKVYKDYSKNGATGAFVPAVHNTMPVVRVVHVDNGFGWGDAAVGAGVAILLIALGTGTALVVRRRHVSPPSPARPAAA